MSLKAYEVEPGQVYETSGGERVEVVRDDCPGQAVLEVRYPEREQLNAEGEVVTATARMSRYSFADMATADGFRRLEESIEPENELEGQPQNLSGRFTQPPPNCPECGAFMSVGYCDLGLPAASCTRLECDAWGLDDREMIEGGYFIEE